MRAGAAGDLRSEVEGLARSLGGPERWPGYFAHHARTFRFAARLLPSEHTRQVVGMYAFCRFTDDLVDEVPRGVGPERVEGRLAAWRDLAREAYRGAETGIPLLDRVLGPARRAGVPWRYPEAILEGVRMDLEPRRYGSWEELEDYTFSVAGAVGGWFAHLFGIRDSAMLERAHALGHGMQLTNILRDVGEDWSLGRLYLPERLLEEHGVAIEDVVARVRGGEPVPLEWQQAMEEVIERAELFYQEAWPGIAALPLALRSAVAVASSAYRGIHREVRANGYDNVTRRAYTGRVRKLALAARGIVRAGRRRDDVDTNE